MILGHLLRCWANQTRAGQGPHASASPPVLPLRPCLTSSRWAQPAEVGEWCWGGLQAVSGHSGICVYRGGGGRNLKLSDAVLRGFPRWHPWLQHVCALCAAWPSPEGAALESRVFCTPGHTLPISSSLFRTQEGPDSGHLGSGHPTIQVLCACSSPSACFSGRCLPCHAPGPLSVLLSSGTAAHPLMPHLPCHLPTLATDGLSPRGKDVLWWGDAAVR